MLNFLMEKNIQTLQTQAALMQTLQDEGNLLVYINELKNRKDLLQSLIEQYNIDLEQFQPVNFLRYHILQLLQQGENITLKLIKQVKEDIESGNVYYFSHFGFEPQLLEKLTSYKEDKKRSIFSNWQHKGKLNYFAIFHSFFYRKIDAEKTNFCLKNIAETLKKRLELNDEHIIQTFNFQGSRNLGEIWASVAIYPKQQKTHQQAVQLFLRVATEGVKSGIKKGSDWKGESMEDEYKIFSNFEDIIIFLKSKRNIYFLSNGIEHATTYSDADALKDVFLAENDFLKLKRTLQYKQNLILQGSAGVGKTFLAKRLAFALLGERDDERVNTIQFHQSFGYEDFIQGIKPNINAEFRRTNGVFYDFCTKARLDPLRPYIFIIDEINRGNISKIFGEILMLIEKDKRHEKYALHLPYQSADEMPFFVPPNVFLIGTMNTADRSLAWLDYALRRRFAFAEIAPQFGEKFAHYLTQQGVTEGGIKTIVEKINALNQLIEEDIHLGKGFKIGHSYFCDFDKTLFGNENEWLENIIEFEIAPLLREYWFDDEAKINRALEKLRLV